MTAVATKVHAPDGTALAALLTSAPARAPGVVVVHGLGSRKENHTDFAERVAGLGMATLAIDLRGHGQSAGEIGPGMLDDVVAALDALAARGHGPLGVRGSSLGGFLALHAAARHAAVRAVVAICPATPEGLATRTGDPWPHEHPLAPTIRPGDGVSRTIWHATGDDVVPWRASAALVALAPADARLRLVAGGGHRTLQHDPDVLDESAAVLADRLGART